jgi:FtsP/CotA-like multicopper oxidase with cupredoxin domain
MLRVFAIDFFCGGRAVASAIIGEAGMFTDKLPIADLDILTTGQIGAWGKITITVAARKALLVDAGAAPSAPNVWSYVRSGWPKEHDAVLPNYLGPVVNVKRGHPLIMRFINALGSRAPLPEITCADDPGMTMSAGEARVLETPPLRDPKSDDCMMNPSVGVVTHLHGAKVHPDSDGWPLRPAGFEHNPYGFNAYRQYLYPNDQRATMLWFHDHAMDNTAQQVHAGLAGLYFVRDESDADILHLIGGETQEIPLVLQDRRLVKAPDGSDAFDYKGGLGEAAGGRPEFLGDRMLVNGRPEPTHAVERKNYRLRILNGSNARSYALTLADLSAPNGGRVWFGDLLTIIGNDGGLSSRAETLTAAGSEGYALIAPGERLDLLVDFSKAPQGVKALVLVNLAVQTQIAKDSPEAIFQTDGDSVAVIPTETTPWPFGAPELHCVQLMQFELGGAAAAPVDAKALAAALAHHADDHHFHWDCAAVRLTRAHRLPRGERNRLLLLMNNTTQYDPAKPETHLPHAVPHPMQKKWSDTQMWELAALGSKEAADPKSPTWELPFAVDLAAMTSARGAPGAASKYALRRVGWFRDPDMPKRVDYRPFGYDALHAPTFRPVAGTYEYWYVANIGNAQPSQRVFTDSTGAENIPDMHPYHMHLVDFVVTRRWRLDETGAFAEITGQRRLDLDRIARHDTVRVQSNELVELLVYFPPGYVGRYPYHCHLVEHEDMGMMLHYEVVAPGAA